MYELNNKVYLSWDDVNKCIRYLKNSYLKDMAGINIVVPYRGGIPMGVVLNHCVPNSTLSIIQYQTRDGNDKEATFAVDKRNPDWDTLLLDDIYDTGKTINYLYEYLLFDSIGKVLPFTLVGTTASGFDYFIRKPNKWVVFPWEHAKSGG